MAPVRVERETATEWTRQAADGLRDLLRQMRELTVEGCTRQVPPSPRRPG